VPVGDGLGDGDRLDGREVGDVVAVGVAGDVVTVEVTAGVSVDDADPNVAECDCVRTKPTILKMPAMSAATAAAVTVYLPPMRAISTATGSAESEAFFELPEVGVVILSGASFFTSGSGFGRSLGDGSR
jgi:hypothetical protein